jgi:hypothetical protein
MHFPPSIGPGAVIHRRRPLLAADQPPAPLADRQALRTTNRAVDDRLIEARIAA